MSGSFLIAEKSKKRPREDVSEASYDEDAPPPSKRWASIEEVEEDEPKSQIARLLDAKRKRRRTGRLMAQEQMNEDLADVKHFMQLPESEKEAYLAIYEYDDGGEKMIQGLTKASSMSLKLGMAFAVHPQDYDLVQKAIDLPEVQDGISLIWDCVDVSEYSDVKAVKMAAAIGHIGDTLLGAAMKAYNAVTRVAEYRRKQQGNQSVFDLGAGDTQHGFQTTAETVPASRVAENASQPVETI